MNRNRRNSHGPSEPDLRNEMRRHDWEKDTPQATSSSSNTISETALLQEPRRETAHSRIEYAVETQRATDTLCQNELIVLSAKTGHHEAENMKEGSSNN